VYQLALVIVYVLAFLGLLEIWPAILHFHYADVNRSLLWEVPIRVAVMPFFLGALLSSFSKRDERTAIVAFAVAPAITFLLSGILQQAHFDWWEIGIWIVAGACSAAGAWTSSNLLPKRRAISASQ
jgi:hypothetical protein